MPRCVRNWPTPSRLMTSDSTSRTAMLVARNRTMRFIFRGLLSNPSYWGSPGAAQEGASVPLRGEPAACGRELAALLRPELRVAQVEARHRLDDRRGNRQPAEPLVVRRHHVPRRVGGCRMADHVLVGLHVFLPVAALAHVRGRELPVLVRVVQPLEKAPFLLGARHVQEELEEQEAVACEIALEIGDVLEALLPDVLADHLRWQLLLRQ